MKTLCPRLVIVDQSVLLPLCHNPMSSRPGHLEPSGSSHQKHSDFQAQFLGRSPFHTRSRGPARGEGVLHSQV